MKYIRIIALLFLCAFSVGAIPLTASWIEGEVFLKDGTQWLSVYVGDEIESTSIIRLNPKSMAEFVSGSRRVSLSSEGTFVLDKLLSSSDAQAHKRSTVVSKLSRVMDSRNPRTTVVAGVRGSFEGAPEKTEWAEDNGTLASLLETGREHIQLERYVDAAECFGLAAAEAIGDTRDEYTYTQAWCLAAGEDLLGAIKILRPMNASKYYAVPRAILLARLSLDTGAPTEALDVLNSISNMEGLSVEDTSLIQELKNEADIAVQ